MEAKMGGSIYTGTLKITPKILKLIPEYSLLNSNAPADSKLTQ